MKKIKILVFDTETTGLPKHYKPAEEDLDNYPSVLQLGAQLVEIDVDNPLQVNIIYKLNMLVRPYRNGKEVSIHPKAEAVHGITFETANALGESIETTALLFQGLCNSADFIVCHNYTFDRNVMVSELLRLGIEAKYKRGAKVFCTMKFSTNLLKLPGKYKDQFKFPRLDELFKHLTGREMQEHYKAHDAEGDVAATVHCLVELINQVPDVALWFKGEKESIY
jgi:DNA polymerase III epsilon subunit-like protein